MQIVQGIVLFVAIASASATSARLAPLLAEDSPSAIDGEYLVVFHDSVSAEEVDVHLEYVQQQVVAELASAESTSPLTPLVIGDFKAYRGKLSDTLRDHVRAMKSVKYVERNQMFHSDVKEMRLVSLDQEMDRNIYPSAEQEENENVGIAGCLVQYNCPAWGLVRTTSRARPTNNNYYFDTQAGYGVDVYVLDSGIASNHPDFQGRVKWGADFVQYPPARTDLYGHGTHVAGTIMSNTYGIAKRATAIDVRVLDANNNGQNDWFISGLKWVWNQHRPGRKSVVNMSLGGSYSQALNDAADAVVNKGIYVVVAAGNSNLNACGISPASAAQVITVMASDINDVMYYVSPTEGSNYGPCTHLIAPGVNVVSTSKNGGWVAATGTSFASPHVAGVIANYLSTTNNLPTPAQMKTYLVNNATPNIVSRMPPNSPNKLLYYGCSP